MSADTGFRSPSFTGSNISTLVWLVVGALVLVNVSALRVDCGSLINFLGMGQ